MCIYRINDRTLVNVKICIGNLQILFTVQKKKKNLPQTVDLLTWCKFGIMVMQEKLYIVSDARLKSYCLQLARCSKYVEFFFFSIVDMGRHPVLSCNWEWKASNVFYYKKAWEPPDLLINNGSVDEPMRNTLYLEALLTARNDIWNQKQCTTFVC